MKPIRIFQMLDLKWKIIDKEGCFPEMLKTFFKCGLVLWKRQQYDNGYHAGDIFDCEIEYAKISDERLIENYNNLYDILILKYGNI